MRNFRFLIGLAIAALLAGCTPSRSLEAAHSDLPREMHPAVPREGVGTLVEGNNAFALELYRSVRAEGGNLVLSPYSISLALGMTFAGARGETEAQMAKVLHFSQGQAGTHGAFNALDLGLAQRGQSEGDDPTPMKLNLVNEVWAEQTYAFLPEFLDTLAASYGAGIRLADFLNRFEAVREEINAWVSGQTEGRIKNLLPEGSLSSYTRMVLVNAIHFKADWLEPFDRESTYAEPFHPLEGPTRSVETMHNQVYAPYLEGQGFQVVELAYAGGTAAMDLFVPDAGTFEAFEDAFDSRLYGEALQAMKPATVDLALPKFTFESGLGLSGTLGAMGMADAFSPDRADFSGMTGARDLFISDVIHKAFIAVDEKGTEAAAATAVIMETTSAPLYDVILKVDRPFLFVIRDTVNGQILFIGRVLNPQP